MVRARDPPAGERPFGRGRHRAPSSWTEQYDDPVTESVPGAGPVTRGLWAPDQESVTDLLGVLAYGELSAFDRMSMDARMAPSLAGRVALSQMAAAEMGHYGKLASHLARHGVNV